jgi:hypothetical protein
MRTAKDAIAVVEESCHSRTMASCPMGPDTWDSGEGALAEPRPGEALNASLNFLRELTVQRGYCDSYDKHINGPLRSG